MRFHIDGQVQAKWADATLSDVLTFIEHNVFWFKNEIDQKNTEGFLYSKKLLGKDTYKIFPKFLELSNPISNKENLICFNATVKNGTPIIEDESSFVFIDLDLKNLNLTIPDGLNSNDIDFDKVLKNIADRLLVSYEHAECESDKEIFNQGLIFIKKSFSGKGIHMLFRIKPTKKWSDLRAYGVEIGRRLEKEFKLDIFSTDVFDTKVFGDNWNMYFNYVKPNDGSYFSYAINPKVEYLEVDDKRLEENLVVFNQLPAYRKGKIKKLSIKKERDIVFAQQMSIDKIWSHQCGEMDSSYVTGNQNRIFYFITAVKTEDFSKEELIDWFENSKPDLIDATTVFQTKDTIREKIELIWDKAIPFAKREVKIEDQALLLFNDKGQLNTGVLDRALFDSGFKRLMLREKNELVDNLIVYREGNELSKITLKTLIISEEFSSFLKCIKITDPHQTTCISRYVTNNLHNLTLETIEYDDLLIDTIDCCYIYTAQGPVEITKDSHKLLKHNIKPYFKSWKAHFWSKIENLNETINYEPLLSLDGFKEKEIFEFLVDEDADKLKRLTGYLTHRYKSMNLNVIYVDSFEGKDGGGAGKSLGSFLLCPIRKVSMLQSPDSSDRFWLSEYSVDSDIMLINEAPRNFDIEKLRGTRDMSLTIECKGKDKISLGPLTPRVIINSNFNILKDEHADKRRTSSLQFSKTFEQEDMVNKFGHAWFYDTHDSNWWSKYLLMMIECVQLYLNDKNIKFEIEQSIINRRILEDMHNNDENDYLYEKIYNEAIEVMGNFTTLEMLKDKIGIRESIINKKIYNYIKQRLNVEYGNDIILEHEIEKTKLRRRGFKLIQKTLNVVNQKGIFGE